MLRVKRTGMTFGGKVFTEGDIVEGLPSFIYDLTPEEQTAMYGGVVFEPVEVVAPAPVNEQTEHEEPKVERKRRGKKPQS